jgi:1-acyl-sn-glycerol-3-phosphate acyltransferase
MECVLGRFWPHRLGQVRHTRWAQRLSQKLCQAIHVRVDVIGQRPSTSLTVFNHLSYLDVLTIGAQGPVVFVAKSEVSRWPIIGRLARRLGTLFVVRDCRRDLVRVGGEMRAAVQGGQSIVLFPEGTSSNGRQVLRFRSGLLEAAVQNEWPVTPAFLGYRLDEADASVHVCWWGTMTLLPHLWRLLRFREIRATLCFGDPILCRDRKELAQRLHEAVVRLAQIPQREIRFRTAEPARESILGS